MSLQNVQGMKTKNARKDTALTRFPFFRWYNRTEAIQHNGAKFGAVLYIWLVVIKRVSGQNTPSVNQIEENAI